MLGREPNREERRGHLARIGDDLGAVVASYLGSLEFERRGLQRPPASRIGLAKIEGFSIYAADDDLAVGRYVLAGSYEPDVTACLRRYLNPGMGVLDLGANIGYVSLLAASIVGPQGCVIAFEPNGDNARLLEASRRLNGFEHLTVCQCAAGPRTELLVLHASFSNGTTSAPDSGLEGLASARTVAAIPPDLLVPAGRRIDLIKADVEGAEWLALSGCRAVIDRDHPVIVSEFSPGMLPGISGIDGAGFIAWLIDRGYAVSVIEPDGSATGPLEPDAVMRVHQARGVDHVDLLAEPSRPC